MVVLRMEAFLTPLHQEVALLVDELAMLADVVEEAGEDDSGSKLAIASKLPLLSLDYHSHQRADLHSSLA